MKYQALYRKYRPKTFDEICGQEVIVKTLKNIVKNNKLTHAYLFVGPRGTGKTSIAKIFAKTINCENNKNGLSCENCEICKNSNINENMDIIEMDAASNNGVDEIREIKNHVTLLPTSSKYKVYIIDEVHMLTTGAFNALLKTLEEPPKHVIFILATTEPHKIPLTIVSRCQCFEFKPISKNKIKENLNKICNKENIKIEDSALDLISLYSNGGMRDAIGLLDQLNVYSDSNIKKEDVIILNGRISEEDIYNLFDSIHKNDIKMCFEIIENFEKTGKDFIYICQDIINYFRNSLLKYKMGEEQKIIDMFDENKIIEMIIMFNNSINDMKNSIDKKIFFDLNIIKILNQYKIDKKNKIQTNVQKNKIIPVEESKNKIDFKDYEELMNIRLNNIISLADKNSLQSYKDILLNLSENIINLDELKIINLLEDVNICAASPNGIIITVDNVNMLEELYLNIFEIEKIFSNKANNNIIVCILMNDYWLDQRKKYITKIKNKEKIEIVDEISILNKIKNKLNEKDLNSNEFEDLIEIGE